MMNKLQLAFVMAALSAAAASAADPAVLRLFDKAVFYDGYRSEVVDKDLDDGILRHRNSLYAVKLTDSQIESMGDDLRIDVTLGALCDNYDRIANIQLALVPKGADTYNHEEVEHLEIARFITPFMNKNVKPDEVPYTFDVSTVAWILHNPAMREAYDFWLESEVFGVPYAANEQVAGCKGRNDVFTLTVDFTSLPFTQQAKADASVIVPVYTKKPEDKGNINFNNYNECATDTIGKTTRTFTFNVPVDCDDARIVLINSNHGAASGGEEYINRLHILYIDGEVCHTYKPQVGSCEPFRQYNTQRNGIYGDKPKNDLAWSLSNWCPGDVIPTRMIHLGAMKAGEHKFMIRVPAARFKNKDGDFRPSLYFHGLTSGNFDASVEDIAAEANADQWNVTPSQISFASNEPIDGIELYSYDGQLLYGTHGSAVVDFSAYLPGSYIAVARLASGRTSFRKVMR